ncbi:MAG: HipA domain-containing protein, partial [Deltaproteobacteria bacterium]|nr:HipA domain-containing protein [Deltaproteobacteria bacterium]
MGALSYHPPRGDSESMLISGEGALPASHTPWLVKFRGLDDDQDAPRVELAYMELARLAGLDVPQTRAFEAEGALYFGVERFDRWWDGELWRRAHIHTLGGLLQADFRVPSCVTAGDTPAPPQSTPPPHTDTPPRSARPPHTRTPETAR